MKVLNDHDNAVSVPAPRVVALILAYNEQGCIGSVVLKGASMSMTSSSSTGLRTAARIAEMAEAQVIQHALNSCLDLSRTRTSWRSAMH